MDHMISSKWCVPAHITGIFQIVENPDPLRMGSRGSGFSLAEAFYTVVEWKKSRKNSFKVYFNNELIDGKVTLEAAKDFSNFFEGKNIKITHFSKLPIGAGFGASGAGALGTAFALNEVFDAGKKQLEIGQIAHKAEVICRTGLGDVISQYKGGAEIRLEPGAPGIGKITDLPWPKDKSILSIVIGAIPTKEIITNPTHKAAINKSSEKLLGKLIANPSLDTFLEVSFEFSQKIGLMKPTLVKILSKLHEKGYSASMIMLGESIFVVDEVDKLTKCAEFIKNNFSETQLWLSTISDFGPHQVNE